MPRLIDDTLPGMVHAMETYSDIAKSFRFCHLFAGAVFYTTHYSFQHSTVGQSHNGNLDTYQSRYVGVLQDDTTTNFEHSREKGIRDFGRGLVISWYMCGAIIPVLYELCDYWRGMGQKRNNYYKRLQDGRYSMSWHN
jgi:hypothetical protein